MAIISAIKILTLFLTPPLEQAILRFEVNFWNPKSKIVVTTKDLIFFKVGFAFFQITIMSLGFQPCDLD